MEETIINTNPPMYCLYDSNGRLVTSDWAAPDPDNPGRWIMPTNSTTLPPDPSQYVDGVHWPYWNGNEWEYRVDEQHDTDFQGIQNQAGEWERIPPRECFLFDRDGWYAGTDSADADPETPGEWLLPANATFVQPPALTGEPDLYPRFTGEGRELQQSQTVRDNAASGNRILRNNYLRASDWTQLLDTPLTEQERHEWVVYRQQLRDLPTLPEWPFVTFPSQPTKPTDG